MKKLILHSFILILVLSSCLNQENKQNNEKEQLAKGFANPPVEARPRALWDWVDGNFSLTAITHELEEGKDKGMGGFDIWDVRKVVDENNIVPAGPAFMSDEYAEGITHAVKEAGRLGLDIGLIIASGWNAGGAWTKPEHQTMGIYRSVIKIEGPKKITEKLPFPVLPDKSGKPGRKKTAIIPRGEDGLPKYYENIAVLAIPEQADSIVNQKEIINISDKMDEKGNLAWDAPEGNWKITRYVCTNTGQPMISSTPNSTGPMIDHFNPEATEAHIKYFIDKLKPQLGELGESALKYFYTDSYEVVGQLWSPVMTAEFKKRMGYDLTPFLPVFDGYIVDNEEITGRFIYDYQKILSDLIIEGHYQKATEMCESHGFGFVAEAAGPGHPVHNCPFESIKSSGVLSFPRGEFWQQHSGNKIDQLQVIKGIASASHLYNQKYVEAEAFTGTYLWQYGPNDLKPTADRAFCEGLNRIIFHTWPHTPEDAGEPGWIYAFGTLMNDTRIWWPMAYDWLDYLGRCSYMLQEGVFHGDILYFYGDSAPNFVPHKQIDPSLGFGYDYDVTNMDILLSKLEVENNKIVTPYGQSYEIMVLPDWEHMNLQVLKKLEKMVNEGATIVGRKPIRSHGLNNYKERNKQVKQLADKIWGACDGQKIKENEYGKGKVIWGKTLKQVMTEKNVGPDFDFNGNIENTNLDFIHRKIGDVDAYFIRNKTSQYLSGSGTFRVTGKQPEIWDPVTGNMIDNKIFFSDNNNTTLPLFFEPYGSVFIVFGNPLNDQNHFVSVKKDGQPIFPQNKAMGLPFKQCKKYPATELVFKQPGEYELIYANGQAKTINAKKPGDPINIPGPWKVTFEKEKNAPASATFDELKSWTESDIDGIKYFSGIAAYHKTFTITEEQLNNKNKIVLDLGKVKEVAHVYINGKDAGILWYTPYRKNISEYLKPGKNTLKIEVANTWANGLAGDAKLPKDERITKSNITRLPNAWSYPLEDIPNEEFGLLESGLMGPVKINIVQHHIID